MIGVQVILDYQDVWRLKQALDSYEADVAEWTGDTNHIKWWIEDWRKLVEHALKVSEAVQLVEEGTAAKFCDGRAKIVEVAL